MSLSFLPPAFTPSKQLNPPLLSEGGGLLPKTGTYVLARGGLRGRERGEG